MSISKAANLTTPKVTKSKACELVLCITRRVVLKEGTDGRECFAPVICARCGYPSQTHWVLKRDTFFR